MWTLFVPKEVKCGACEHITRSRLNRIYQTIFLITFSIAVFLAYILFWEMGIHHGIRTTSKFLGGLLLFSGISGALFFSRNAHSCAHCDSPYVKEPE